MADGKEKKRGGKEDPIPDYEDILKGFDGESDNDEDAMLGDSDGLALSEILGEDVTDDSRSGDAGMYLDDDKTGDYTDLMKQFGGDDDEDEPSAEHAAPAKTPDDDDESGQNGSGYASLLSELDDARRPEAPESSEEVDEELLKSFDVDLSFLDSIDETEELPDVSGSRDDESLDVKAITGGGDEGIDLLAMQEDDEKAASARTDDDVSETIADGKTIPAEDTLEDRADESETAGKTGFEYGLSSDDTGDEEILVTDGDTGSAPDDEKAADTGDDDGDDFDEITAALASFGEEETTGEIKPESDDDTDMEPVAQTADEGDDGNGLDAMFDELGDEKTTEITGILDALDDGGEEDEEDAGDGSGEFVLDIDDEEDVTRTLAAYSDEDTADDGSDDTEEVVEVLDIDLDDEEEGAGEDEDSGELDLSALGLDMDDEIVSDEPPPKKEEDDFLGLGGGGATGGSTESSGIGGSDIMFEGIEMDYEEQITLVTRAEVLLSQGKRDAAREILKQVEDQKGATHWVQKRLNQLKG